MSEEAEEKERGERREELNCWRALCNAKDTGSILSGDREPVKMRVAADGAGKE